MPSYEDRRALEIMKASMRKEDDGSYVIRQPWRQLPPKLPNNRGVALKRFEHLDRRFHNDPNYFDEYKTAIEEYVNEGWAEVVPENELKKEDGSVHYVAHHGVRHPRKLSLRVVFDTGSSHQIVGHEIVGHEIVRHEIVRHEIVRHEFIIF